MPTNTPGKALSGGIPCVAPWGLPRTLGSQTASACATGLCKRGSRDARRGVLVRPTHGGS
eukprot:61963-Chlamydomonas_euryale.AAC.1